MNDRVSGLARVVAVVSLELGRPVGVRVGRPRPARRSTHSRLPCTGGGVGGRRPPPRRSSSSSAQASVSNSCTEKPMSAAWAAMSVATSSWPRSALHRNPARRLPSSSSTQSTASRHPGPFQRSHRAAASPPEVRGVPSRVRSSAPASASRSSANCRIVSNSAVAGAGRGVVGDDERLADERVEVPQHVDLVGVVDARRRCSPGRSRRRRPTRCAAASARRRSAGRRTTRRRGGA